jgi:hypothetical protein
MRNSHSISGNDNTQKMERGTFAGFNFIQEKVSLEETTIMTHTILIG